MKAREVLDRTETPDGRPLELARERGYFVLRVAGVPLMSSGAYGSEQRMAEIARERLPPRAAPRVLVGGLGMGFTLRAVLDTFGPRASVTVAELLPPVVAYNRGVLGHLAGHPLDDPRVELFSGDVRACLERGGWDAVLLDVDNGPDALTVPENGALYGDGEFLARSLTPGGVLVVWSSFPSPAFLTRLRRAGLRSEELRVPKRAGARAGGRHVLFVACAPGPGPSTAHGARRPKVR
jgi:spermidine synthase